MIPESFGMIGMFTSALFLAMGYSNLVGGCLLKAHLVPGDITWKLFPLLTVSKFWFFRKMIAKTNMEKTYIQENQLDWPIKSRC